MNIFDEVLAEAKFDSAVELAYGQWKEVIIQAAFKEMLDRGVAFKAEHSYTIHFEDKDSEKIGQQILDKANAHISKATKGGGFPFLTVCKSPEK